MPGVRFERVGLRYGGRTVLEDVTLELTEHRVGVVGANGSGKSSLVRMVNGLVRPTTGTVTVEGLDVARHTRAVRRRVGFLFPDADSQIVMPTVREDLQFSLRGSGLPRAEAAARVEAALAAYGLGALADHPCHLLSGGEKQLLALAAVLLTEPSVLVADEPTTLLDRRNVRLVAARLAALPQQLVLVTHHLELLEDFDRVVVVEGGRVVADDAPHAALEHYVRLVG